MNFFTNYRKIKKESDEAYQKNKTAQNRTHRDQKEKHEAFLKLKAEFKKRKY